MSLAHTYAVRHVPRWHRLEMYRQAASQNSRFSGRRKSNRALPSDKAVVKEECTERPNEKSARSSKSPDTECSVCCIASSETCKSVEM